MSTTPTSRLAPSTGVDRAGLEADITRRRVALAEVMAAHGIDALVVASEANTGYLTGYETTFFGNKSKPFVVVYAPPHKPYVVCHVGEEPSVRLDAVDVLVEPYVGPEVLAVRDGVQIDYQVPAADAVAALLDRLEVGSIGLEASWHFIPGFTPLALDRLREAIRGEVIDASPALWHVRRVKSEWEIEQMRIAANAAAGCHAIFADEARLGMTERELGRLLRRAAYEAGAERIGYSGIIAGIDRAPLGGPTDRTWERGQMLFVDICLQLNGGYFADFNRIYASAPPTRDQRDAYGAVVDALDRAREVTRAGAVIADLANAMIGDVPTIYARVGHGLGLEMPEPPSLSPQDTSTLRAGEVICIEPNREVPGVGWLVSEETVAVREGGFELLSPPFPRELGVIG
jgi:Xaa-Pro aminopeptidase